MRSSLMYGLRAPVYSATCELEATTNNIGPVTGRVSFVELADGNLRVSVVASGLTNGTHGYHVHTYGDISSGDGMSTGGHFVGDCNACRPAGQPQEVGLLNNGTKLVTTPSGSVNFTYVEEVAKLWGVNSIVGRAIIIHGNANGPAPRVAQCVIGRRIGNISAPGTVQTALCIPLMASFLPSAALILLHALLACCADAPSPVMRPAVSTATCFMKATANSPISNVWGKITFTSDPSSADGALSRVEWLAVPACSHSLCVGVLVLCGRSLRHVQCLWHCGQCHTWLSCAYVGRHIQLHWHGHCWPLHRGLCQLSPQRPKAGGNLGPARECVPWSLVSHVWSGFRLAICGTVPA